MTFAALALVAGTLLSAPDPKAEEVRIRRKTAYSQGNFAAALDHAEEEYRVRSAHPRPHDQALCDAIEAGWQITSERIASPIELDGWRERHRQHCLTTPEGEVSHQYQMGLAALVESRLDDAWDAFQTAIALAREHRLPLYEASALAKLTELAARFGDPDILDQAFDDTLAVGRRALAEAPVANARHIAAHYNTLGWSLLLRVEAGHTIRRSPGELLLAALRIYEGLPDGDAMQAHSVRVNLAVAATQRADPHAALAHLAPIVLSDLNPDDRLWYRIAEARSHLALGRWRPAEQAIRAVADLARHAGPGRVGEWTWHAHMLLGTLHEARDRPAAALLAYSAAEAAVDQHLTGHSLRPAVHQALDDFAASARRSIALQHSDGDLAGALCTVRRARTRGLRSLAAVVVAQQPAVARKLAELDRQADQCHREMSTRRSHCVAAVERDRRELQSAVELGHPTRATTCDDLTPPADHELLLAFYRLDDGWIALAQDSRATRSYTQGTRDPGAFAKAALDVFAAEIERASRVRILATGEMHAIDFHLLPWRGEPLIAHAPVTYSLDLPAPLAPADPSHHAVVLGSNPTADLSRVDRESSLVGRTLEQHGLRVDSFTGAGSVTRDALRSALAGDLELLHFAGHNVITSTWDVWGTGLLLEDQVVLSVGSILWQTNPANAPQTIVLSACNSGLADDMTIDGGVGVAQAFLLRGTQFVIGTTAPISDETAYAMSEAMYSEWPLIKPFDGPSRLSAAQLRLIRTGHSILEIGKFRIWSR